MKNLISLGGIILLAATAVHAQPFTPEQFKVGQDTYARHCRDVDLMTAPLRDCLSYYNGDGKAEPGSLAYYGGPAKWHQLRTEAQASLEHYLFDHGPA